MVHGKSGTLLEDFGLMKKGTYDRTRLLSVNNKDRQVREIGCEDIFPNYSENDNNFEKQTICMNVLSHNVAVTSTFKTKNKDPNYSIILELDSNNKNLVLTDVDQGLASNFTAEDKKYNPLVLFTKNPQNGQIYVFNFNPTYGGSRVMIINSIALALSKDLIMTSKVKMNVNVDNDLYLLTLF